MAELSSGHDATVLKEMIMAVAVEEIDRGETMTQATVVETMIVAAARQNEDVVAASDDMMTMTTDEAAGVRNDEQALLSSCCKAMGWKKIVKNKRMWKRNMREMECEKGACRAKAAADCIVQTQEGEMVEAGREGGIMTHEKSVPEVERPYFVVSKWEEKSGGVDEESVHVTKKNKDVLLQKVKQFSEMTVNASKLLSEVLSEKRSEKNEGLNPEEVVQDDVMECEWKEMSCRWMS